MLLQDRQTFCMASIYFGLILKEGLITVYDLKLEGKILLEWKGTYLKENNNAQNLLMCHSVGFLIINPDSLILLCFFFFLKLLWPLGLSGINTFSLSEL